MPDFVPAIALDQLPQEGFVPLELQGQSLLIGRVQGQLFAFLDRCPHAGAPLRLGTLTACTLVCARHGWAFDVLTGASVPHASAFALTTFPTQLSGPTVLIGL
jgi:toluene monooxygenase system ferredoxin subunit